nr:hypothetical protein [Ichthyobacterium seriolicida]
MEKSESIPKTNCHSQQMMHVMKSTFLALREATKKWSKPIPNWGIILNQFLTIFDERVRL